jgi:hypothetical protein
MLYTSTSSSTSAEHRNTRPWLFSRWSGPSVLSSAASLSVRQMVAVEQVSLGSPSPSPSPLSLLSGESAWGSVQKPLLTAVRRAGWQRCNGHRVTELLLVDSSSSTNEREQPCAANQPRGRLTTRVWTRTQMQAGPPLNPATDSSPPTARPDLVVYYCSSRDPRHSRHCNLFFFFCRRSCLCRWPSTQRRRRVS